MPTLDATAAVGPKLACAYHRGSVPMDGVDEIVLNRGPGDIIERADGPVSVRGG